MKSLKYRITLWYSLFAIALTAMMLFAIVRIAIIIRTSMCGITCRSPSMLLRKKQLIHKIRTWKSC